jgi:hypothetical protein
VRKLTARERRLIRFSALGLGLYLIAYLGFAAFRGLEELRAEHGALRRYVQSSDERLARALVEQQRLARLRRQCPLALERLDQKTVVGDARVALEQAAKSCGVSLATVRETPGRLRALEHTVFQVSGGGKDQNVVRFVDRMHRLGYPFVLDNVQVKAAKAPGQVTFSFSAALLDFARWSGEEARGV